MQSNLRLSMRHTYSSGKIDIINQTSLVRLGKSSDSQAAIAAVKKAGCTEKARTRDLRKVIQHVRNRQDRMGPGAVRLGWVKSHIGTHGNEKADEQAKLGAQELYPDLPYITEGGLKQEWKKRRER